MVEGRERVEVELGEVTRLFGEGRGEEELGAELGGGLSELSKWLCLCRELLT